MWATVDELEGVVGSQVRERRLQRNLTLGQVAEQAGLARRTVQNLEHGHGSTVATLIQVLRVLDADDWLTTLAPPEPISPVALRDQRQRRRQRASGGDRG